MKIKICCDSNANIHSKHESEWMDIEEFGYTAEEWEALSDDQKHEEVKAFCFEYLNL